MFVNVSSHLIRRLCKFIYSATADWFTSYSNSNWTFIAFNLLVQKDSNAQQNHKSSHPNFNIQRQKRGQAPRRMPGDEQG